MTVIHISSQRLLLSIICGSYLLFLRSHTFLSVLTESGKMADVTCGATECETRGAENRACLPITVAKNDPDFGGKQCLMFVRTQEVLRDDCTLGT